MSAEPLTVDSLRRAFVRAGMPDPAETWMRVPAVLKVGRKDEFAAHYVTESIFDNRKGLPVPNVALGCATVIVEKRRRKWKVEAKERHDRSDE